MRTASQAKLAQNNVNKKNLTKALNNNAFYRERMAAIQPKKKEKQRKYGNVGMDDINRHGYNDLYEKRKKDKQILK